MNKTKLCFFVNNVDFFISHRLPIALAAKKNGFEVHLVAPGAHIDSRVEGNDIVGHNVFLTRSGQNPLVELYSLVQVYLLFKKIAPDILHMVTIKPVLYGGILSHFLSCSSLVFAISGLGSVFSARTKLSAIRRKLILYVYKIAFHHKNAVVVFQNANDKNLFLEYGIVSSQNSELIPGSGVDLEEYKYSSESRGTPVVLFASRLLNEKGVSDFVLAAQILTAKGVRAIYRIVGDVDAGNPSSITQNELRLWSEMQNIEILGHRADMPQIINNANIICLPSYYGEGLPKFLIEAAASGRAIVTTDHPGCRDAVIPGVSGLLVPIQNPGELADAIRTLISDHELRESMGAAGRRLAEERFSILLVVEAHLAIYRTLLRDEAY